MYSEKDGFTSKDLLQFGVDHLESARILFRQGAHCYDSAGYLTQLGLELILKAWHLYQFKQFDNTHHLGKLYHSLRDHVDGIPLKDEQLELLIRLDTFYELRYPRPHNPVETGTEDWEKIDAMIDLLWQQMPADLLAELERIDPTRKGGRVLMKKKIEN